jgi:hypothetical protein
MGRRIFTIQSADAVKQLTWELNFNVEPGAYLDSALTLVCIAQPNADEDDSREPAYVEVTLPIDLHDPSTFTDDESHAILDAYVSVLADRMVKSLNETYGPNVRMRDSSFSAVTVSALGYTPANDDEYDAE